MADEAKQDEAQQAAQQDNLVQQQAAQQDDNDQQQDDDEAQQAASGSGASGSRSVYLRGPVSLPQRPILRDRRSLIWSDGERHVTLCSLFLFILCVQNNNINEYFLFITWTVVDYAGGHRRNPNGILDLLRREHFPGLVEYAGVKGHTYNFDHYAVAPDAVNRDDREFNNKAEHVKQEL
jgi:hypothetical protein